MKRANKSNGESVIQRAKRKDHSQTKLLSDLEGTDFVESVQNKRKDQETSYTLLGEKLKNQK